MTLDHLVLAVPDLTSATAAFAKTHGVTPATGGTHPGRGTHNALLGLTGGAYLELVAAHPSEPHGPDGRWMGVDLVTAPTLTRWAVRDVDVGAFAKTLHTAGHPALATLAEGRRRTPAGQLLRWRMTEPQPAPAVQTVPFALDWSDSEAHPADSLPPALTLQGLRLGHPNPARLRATFDALRLDYVIAEAPTPYIEAHLSGPRGTFVLR